MEKKFEINQVCKHKKNINVDEREERIMENLKMLHLQGRKWKHIIVVMHHVGNFIM
jgi:hypothetical protein